MLKFQVHKTVKEIFRFRLKLTARFIPVILYGIGHSSQESCIRNIEQTMQQIVLIKYLAFIGNKKGYRFIVFSEEGKIIAYSKYFSTQKMMQRILSILQKYISNAAVEIDISSNKIFHAA